MKEITPVDLTQTLKGSGFYRGDSLVRNAFDFSQKNYLPISTMHELQKRIFFPEKFPENLRLNLTENQLDYLKQSMKSLPYQKGYDRKEYYDSYVKFFVFGDYKEELPDYIKIYNKVGYAYGHVIDCAYIVDERRNVECIITAALLVNEDGIFNDDKYEYDTVGIPFLDILGDRILYYLASAK